MHCDNVINDTDLNAHGLGEPLDDGEERVGGEHGGLVRLRVDELAHVAGDYVVMCRSMTISQPVVRFTQGVLVERGSKRRHKQLFQCHNCVEMRPHFKTV